MSILGDIVKGAKKAVRKIKKVGGEIAKATREVRPIIGSIGPVGAGVATGLAALDPGDERARKKSGRPPPRGILTPSLVRQQRRFLERTFTAGVRQATGRMEPRVRVPLVSTAPTPAFQRTVPGTVQAATARPAQRRPIMPLRPIRGPIRATPALQFQVPRSLREPVQTLKEQLPFTFGEVPGGTAREITPLTASVDKMGRPLVVAPAQETRIRCPPGYLAVTMPDGSRACALAGVAIAAGLARRRRKPLISVKETRALLLADRARGKIKRVAQKSGFQVSEKRRATRRRSSK